MTVEDALGQVRMQRLVELDEDTVPGPVAAVTFNAVVGQRYLRRYIGAGREIEKIEAVTADDILELADELINPAKMTYTLLGPVDDEKKELEEILAR